MLYFMILYAVINGFLDDIPMDKVTVFETDFHRFMETNYADMGKGISATKDLDDKTEETLKKAIEEFKQGFIAK